MEEFVQMWASQYFYCSYSQLTRVKTAVKILSITLETSLSLILEIPHETVWISKYGQHTCAI